MRDDAGRDNVTNILPIEDARKASLEKVSEQRMALVSMTKGNVENSKW